MKHSQVFTSIKACTWPGWWDCFIPAPRVEAPIIGGAELKPVLPAAAAAGAPGTTRPGMPGTTPPTGS